MRDFSSQAHAEEKIGRFERFQNDLDAYGVNGTTFGGTRRRALGAGRSLDAPARTGAERSYLGGPAGTRFVCNIAQLGSRSSIECNMDSIIVQRSLPQHPRPRLHRVWFRPGSTASPGRFSSHKTDAHDQNSTLEASYRDIHGRPGLRTNIHPLPSIGFNALPRMVRRANLRRRGRGVVTADAFRGGARPVDGHATGGSEMFWRQPCEESSRG